jgi:hypothetical protein
MGVYQSKAKVEEEQDTILALNLTKATEMQGTICWNKECNRLSKY